MAKTRILHFSDFHNGYDELAAFTKYAESRKDIDLVVHTGDILGPCVNGQQANYLHDSLENIIQNQKDKKLMQENLEKMVASEDFKKVEKTFDKAALEHYKKFSEEADKMKKPFITLPGNWDSPKQYLEALEKYNIHGASKNLNGLKMIGYGGSNGPSVFVPITRQMPYQEEEYKEILEKEKPDIIISHMPPKGILDGKEQIGSQSLREYIDKHHPKLVLCGHSHGYGSMTINGTTIVNAGNMGGYGNEKSKGTFAEIEIDGDKISVKHYRIDDKGKISEIKNKIVEMPKEEPKKEKKKAA